MCFAIIQVNKFFTPVIILLIAILLFLTIHFIFQKKDSLTILIISTKVQLIKPFNFQSLVAFNSFLYGFTLINILIIQSMYLSFLVMALLLQIFICFRWLLACSDS